MVIKSLKFLLILLLIVSCRDKKEEVKLQNAIKIEVENANKDTTTIVQNESQDIVEFKNVFNILLPATYRISNDDNPAKELTNDWFDLFEKDGKYYIEKATYTISKGNDECSGLDTRTIETNRKTILLIEDSKLKTGEIDSLPIVKKYIWPKQKQEFTFNNQTYTLRGEGTMEGNPKITNETSDDDLWGKIKTYKLYLTTTGFSEVLILSQDEFQDTFVELKFVGDIDRDGKLDFIFGANRNYEETRIILFLSSEAEENKVIKKVSEISIQFDC